MRLSPKTVQKKTTRCLIFSKQILATLFYIFLLKHQRIISKSLFFSLQIIFKTNSILLVTGMNTIFRFLSIKLPFFMDQLFFCCSDSKFIYWSCNIAIIRIITFASWKFVSFQIDPRRVVEFREHFFSRNISSCARFHLLVSILIQRHKILEYLVPRLRMLHHGYFVLYRSLWKRKKRIASRVCHGETWFPIGDIKLFWHAFVKVVNTQSPAPEFSRGPSRCTVLYARLLSWMMMYV